MARNIPAKDFSRVLTWIDGLSVAEKNDILNLLNGAEHPAPIERGCTAPEYRGIRVHHAIRQVLHNNGPMHYRDIATVIGVRYKSVGVYLSTRPEFESYGLGIWNISRY